MGWTANRTRFTVERLLSTETGAAVVSHFKWTKDKTARASVKLTDGANRILTLPNAGGSSVWSEALSFEILSGMFNAQLKRTEMELEYWPHGCKITDYEICAAGRTLGVSVTRALKFGGEFTMKDAAALLNKKLYGVQESSRCVQPTAYTQQVLHLWAMTPAVAQTVQQAFDAAEPDLKGNTVLVITVCHNCDWLFNENWD